MEQFADDLAGLLDGLAIREPVVLCGLSMGGYIAFQFWRKYAARLRGLILCDTRAAADTPEAAAGRRSMAERVLREGPAPLVETHAAETVCRDDAAAAAASGRSGCGSVMMAGDPRGIAAAARGMAERPDMTAVLGADSLPHAGARRPERRDLAAGRDARHCRGDSRRKVRRDSRRRPHGAAGEPGGGERGDRRFLRVSHVVVTSGMQHVSSRRTAAVASGF